MHFFQFGYRNSNPTPIPKPLASLSPFRAMSGMEKLTSMRIGSSLIISFYSSAERDMGLPVHDPQTHADRGIAYELIRILNHTPVYQISQLSQ